VVARMIRPILRYGAPELHQRAEAVHGADPDLPALVADLVETMKAAAGVGLAAPQVGVSKRVFVIDLSADQRACELVVLVNPEFVSREGLQLEEEGCLSVPGFQATVPRPASVTIRGLDHDGRQQTLTATGLLARALQHEMDHLDGVLFIDRLRPINRRLIVRRIEARRRRGDW
jgi:peptide deformylase